MSPWQATGNYKFSEATVVKHKKNYPGMPIRLEGARWIGDPVKLEAFYQDLAAGETDKWLEPAVK